MHGFCIPGMIVLDILQSYTEFSLNTLEKLVLSHWQHPMKTWNLEIWYLNDLIALKYNGKQLLWRLLNPASVLGRIVIEGFTRTCVCFYIRIFLILNSISLSGTLSPSLSPCSYKLYITYLFQYYHPMFIHLCQSINIRSSSFYLPLSSAASFILIDNNGLSPGAC